LGTVSTIDLQHGRVVRTVFVGATPATPLVDGVRGRVFIASLGAVSILDARNGRLLHTVTSRQTIALYPLALDTHLGTVYAAGFNGQTIDAFDSRSGHLRYSTAVPGNPEAVVADDSTDRVFAVVGQRGGTIQGVTTDTASLCVIDGRTGRILRVFSLGVGSGGRIYLDEHAHRALVLLSGAQIVSRPDPWGWMPPSLRARLLFVLGRPSGGQTVQTSVSIIDTSSL